MSVLIRGMEMPMLCGCCFLRGYCVHRIYMERRPKDCPLVEVKEPHGNLVDLDQIVNDYWDSHSMVIGHKELDEIEVVIEAEGSEE